MHPRPVLAETGDRTIHQFWCHLFKGFVAYAKTIHDAGAKVLDHDIRRFDKSEEQRLTFGIFQVDGDRLFSSVLSQKRNAHSLGI